MIVLIFVLLLISTNFGLLVRRNVVEGRSMLRAYGPGDHVLVESLTYRLRRPRVGEVVVLRRPGGAARRVLKRVVAGPGTRVSVWGEDRVLGPGEWFVLGDNLDESTDSREWGPVGTKDIVARVWLKY